MTIRKHEISIAALGKEVRVAMGQNEVIIDVLDFYGVPNIITASPDGEQELRECTFITVDDRGERTVVPEPVGKYLVPLKTLHIKPYLLYVFEAKSVQNVVVSQPKEPAPEADEPNVGEV